MIKKGMNLVIQNNIKWLLWINIKSNELSAELIIQNNIKTYKWCEFFITHYFFKMIINFKS